MSLEERHAQETAAEIVSSSQVEPPPTVEAPQEVAGKITSDGLIGPRLPNDTVEEKIDANVFGSFWIDKTEFAIPVSTIHEVVNEPERYSPVPLSPPHVRGLFNLRKMIIPVVDLRILLGYPERGKDEGRKIAIIENGTLCVGLLFDDTGGVINGSGVARVMFQPNSAGQKDVIIEGVLKLNDGARMVQLLDPYELLKIEKLPRIARHGVEDDASHLGRRHNCITFQLGHTQCAIDLRFVQEITDIPELHKSQVAHGHTIGNIELRGVTMPIVDFRGMIGTEKPYAFNEDTLRHRKLVVMKLAEGYVGLVVYSIDNIMSFFEGEILPFANVALPRYDLVAGCLINDADEIVILLDHERLMRDSLLVEAAQSCKEIYPSEPTKQEAIKRIGQPKTRSTYILFQIGTPLAFDISCVSEIIDRPEKLLQPPYALDFVDGILNLRGELIALINPRVIYGLAEKDVPECKVLIFQTGAKKYGMVVDSIDEIVTFHSKELVPFPSISKTNKTRIVSEDVIGCLQVSSKAFGSDPVMVLDVKKLIARCVEAEGSDVGQKDQAQP